MSKPSNWMYTCEAHSLRVQPTQGVRLVLPTTQTFQFNPFHKQPKENGNSEVHSGFSRGTPQTISKQEIKLDKAEFVIQFNHTDVYNI